jgi:hypothetical protein
VGAGEKEIPVLGLAALLNKYFGVGKFASRQSGQPRTVLMSRREQYKMKSQSLWKEVKDLPSEITGI